MRRAIAFVLVVGLGLTALACGREAPLGSGPFCAIDEDLDATFDRHFSALPENATPEQAAKVAITASKEAIASGKIDEALEFAPEIVRSDVEFLVRVTRETAAGDPTGFLSPEVEEADERLHSYCGFEEEEEED